MGKHVPHGKGLIHEIPSGPSGDEPRIGLFWDEFANLITLSQGDQRISFTYDSAGTAWRMLSYLLVPTGTTGRYT